MSNTATQLSTGGLQLQLSGGLFVCQETESLQPEEGIIELEAVEEGNISIEGSVTIGDDAYINEMLLKVNAAQTPSEPPKWVRLTPEGDEAILVEEEVTSDDEFYDAQQSLTAIKGPAGQIC